MADCSKTEVFLAETDRMCDDCGEDFRDIYCESCPITALCDADHYNRKRILDEAIEFVQKWSDEHPAPKPKTYADVFREKFPKNTIQDWALWQHEICRKQLFEGADTERCEGDCKECWNEPYKEDEANG